MTFSDTMETMNASTRNAAKRGQMGGYLWKFDTAKNGLAALTTTEKEAGGFRIAFVQRDGDQFIYTYDGATGQFAYNGKVAGNSGALDNATAPTAGNTLVLDAELLLHQALGTDWTVGAQADFEAARTGSGEW